MSMQSVLKSFFQYEITLNPASDAKVFILGSEHSDAIERKFKELVEKYSLAAHKIKNQKLDKSLVFIQSHDQAVWIIRRKQNLLGTHHGLLDESEYAFFRDQCGSLNAQFKTHVVKAVQVEFIDCSSDIVRGSIVGLELAAYQFSVIHQNKKNELPKINLNAGKKENELLKQSLKQALCEAQATQLARHLVNLPPNEINPETVQTLALKQIKFPKSVQITVWDQKRLAKENMNLLLAVGKGSETAPRMIHIKYRPSKKSSLKPIAFVGKGITFDTGGLDIKPSSAMRLMKKDMGGAAAVIGLAYWVAMSGYSRACDFYLALAENSVDAAAMRPSDLYRSRAGYVVEIDNTDAEGRLVLADVMDVAAKQKGKDEPEVLIDIATLTGAIKVALGAEVAGLFSNHDELAQQLTQAGQKAGDYNWRMPLISKYWSSLNSSFADFKNSADGFGGAITAALFLEKFAAGKKWAHLDVYSWVDKPNGALVSVGGSGQPVQAMIEWLKTQV